MKHLRLYLRSSGSHLDRHSVVSFPRSVNNPASFRLSKSNGAAEPANMSPDSAVEIETASAARSFRSEDNGPVPLSKNRHGTQRAILSSHCSSLPTGKMTLPRQRWVSSLLQDPAALDGGIYFNCGIRDYRPRWKCQCPGFLPRDSPHCRRSVRAASD